MTLLSYALTVSLSSLLGLACVLAVSLIERAAFGRRASRRRAR